MASPESDKTAPKSPPVKDSPIFGYVSSLSPIQPVNARPTSQLYENINVPSPQMVFKTPSFIRPRISSLLERSHHPSSPDYANNIREFSDMTLAFLSLPVTQLISHTGKECTSSDPSPNQSCTSPSNCVNTFLADPSENGDNSSSSPEFCVTRATKSIEGNNTDCCENQLKSLKKDLLQDHPCTSAILVNKKTDDNTENSTSMVLRGLPSNQDAYPPQNSQDDSISIEESPPVLHVADEEDGRLRVQYKTKEDPVNASMVSEVMGIHKGSITEQMEPVPKNVSAYTNTLNMADFISHREHYSLDQHATDHSLVSRAKDCDIPICEKEIGMTSDSKCQSEQDLKVHAARTGQSDELDCTPQLYLDSPRNIQSCYNHIDKVALMSSASTGSQISLDQEDCAQHQRGNRKRLRFEAVENLRISSRNSSNCTTAASNVDSQISPFETASVSSPFVKSITMSSYKQMIQSVPVTVPCRLLNKVDRSGQYKASPAIVPRPTRIGLHLNSIVSAASMSCNSNVQPLERNASVQEEKALGEDNDQVPEKSKNCPITKSLIYPAKLSISSEMPLHYAAIENNEENQQGNQVFQLQHSSGSYQSPLSMEPLKQSVPSKLIDRNMTPCTMNIHSEEAYISEESTQTSPRKKRKKASENGHKHCNCKRSKCLKLYCDCFAAGSFCSEACACRDCSNRLEYEGTVLETRQQIESRNPLAFAPKVVLRVSDPPKTSGENKPITPTSARHKRGCNCKRSLCLKKYCECFQAGVGCSLGCRCEGCKNTFGMKDGREISEMVVEHKRPKEGGFERDLSGELENIEVKRQVSNTKQCHSRFSPLTPVVQTSMGNDMPKAQLPASYYPSPDSVASIVRAYEPSEEKSGSSSFIPYDTESDYNNEGKVDPLSAGWEGLQDLCNPSPFLKTSPDIGGSSCVSTTGDHRILQMKLFQESGRISLGSLCWRSSPITLLPQFGESKFVREPDSDSQHCNPEDDTPEILKETRSPIKLVKATSPNQKRVSPPNLAMGDTNKNSPSGLRSGRKFILKSVPTFPPLTPYSKSNGEDGT